MPTRDRPIIGYLRGRVRRALWLRALRPGRHPVLKAACDEYLRRAAADALRAHRKAASR